LIERIRILKRESLLPRSAVPCLRLVAAFADGETLLEEGDRLGLEGVVNKRKAAPYRSGECRDWRKEANDDRGNFLIISVRYDR
jgi:ATP-dependent DNA ligase